MELSNTLGQATTPSKSLPQLMRRHPLASYFVLAYGLAWLGWLPFVLSQSGVGLLPFDMSAFSIVPGVFLGPAFSGFLMTAVVGGKVGIRRFLKRFIDWRVGWQWYLFVLLGIPAFWLLGALTLPGVLPALTLSSLATAMLGYPGLLLLTFLIDGGGEEPGWRGFALPRLQTRYGPLLGTFILGVLWASWHLPLFLTNLQAGGPGVSLLTDLWHFALYVPSTVFEAIIITWVFNSTRGSMLIAMLIHGVGDASPLPASLLPVLNSLYGNFRGFALAILLVNGIIALLLIILTRGRLSYERYQREVIQSHHQGTPSQPTAQFTRLLRRHPLFFYFLIAYAITWSIGLLFLVLLHLPLHLWLLLPLIAGPTVSAFIMTAVTEGKAGVGRLLRRYVLWRVGLPWYLLVLIGIPALLLLSILVLPGGMAVVLHQLLMPIYPIGFILGLLLGGPLFEEPGWRGFALPRLQQRFGPLWGTFVLGVLWAFWHLPLYFVPGFNGAGTDFVGIVIPFGEFVISALAMSVLFTWVFNNTRGSLLLAILLHASIDAAVPTFASPLVFLMVYASLFVLALLIIVATRGRLSYERYQREVPSPTPKAVVGQEPIALGRSS